jgi:integrase
MAWLAKKKKRNPETSRKATYYTICWRDETTRVRSKGIGFVRAKEAQKLLKAFERRLAAGLPVEPPRTGPSSPKKPEAFTLQRYLDDVYLPIVKRDKAPKTYQTCRGAANALIKVMGRRRLDQIDFAMVETYISKRKKQGRRSRTVIIELRLLKRALDHAVNYGVLEQAPVMPSLKDNDRRPIPLLTRDQAERLLQELRPFDVQPHRVTRGRPPINRDPLTYLAIVMILNTGMRKGEALTRNWTDIRWDDGETGSIFVGAHPEIGFDVKTRRDRVIPISPELRVELEKAHTEAGRPSKGWIFPSPKDPYKPRATFNKSLARACERAGLPHVHPHALRHAWASRLAMEGVDRWTLMSLGGWKDGRVLDEIYAHVTSAHVREAVMRTGIKAKDGPVVRLVGEEEVVA